MALRGLMRRWWGGAVAATAPESQELVQGRAGRRPQTWGLPNDRNDQRLAALKNIHRGRRAFLIGNGPSLNANDLAMLKDEITFASNKIYLIYDQTDWRPTYLTCCDAVVARNLKDTFLELPTRKVFAFGTAERYQDCLDEITWVNPPSADGDAEWDAIKGFRAGHSVINLDIKLAYWMGITEMYVIGIDFSFVVPQTTTGEEVFGNKVIVSEGEVNHFHPDYRPQGEEWTVPKLEEQRREFALARQFLEARNRKIYNASRRSKLDVWELIDLDAVLQGGAIPRSES